MTAATKAQRAVARAEINHNVEQLRRWLATHEPRSTWSPGQYRAYYDRMAALSSWIAKSQLIDR